MKIKKLKTGLLLASLSLSIAANLVLGVFWIDLSLSYSYLKATHETTTSNTVLANRLLNIELIGASKEAVFQKLSRVKDQEQAITVVLKDEPENNVIWMNEIMFQFEDGKLSKIGSNSQCIKTC